MVDIFALMRALPVSALEPNRMASIGGFVDVPKDECWRECFDLLEPPAGQRVPYIDPVLTLEKLLSRQSAAPEGARTRARAAVVRLKGSVEASRWIDFFDHLEPDSPECLPVSDFVAWLRRQALVPSDVVDFLEQAAEVTANSPVFRGPDNWDAPWSLENLPASPPSKAMIEFLPGAPWHEYEWDADKNPFLTWREAIRPVVQALEKSLGEPVYHFADPQSDCGDDAVHRFLVLHWCCTHKPESAFVKHLIAASGARDVEELKAALINPANYMQPFKMNDAFLGLESLACRFVYIPPGTCKTVAVVFSTPEARIVAQWLLAQKIGAHVCIIAPKTLATDEWIEQATRYCRSREVHDVYDQRLRDPIGVLALVDELCVIAAEKRSRSGFDLMLSDATEELLWLAIDFGVDAAYFFLDGSRLSNPGASLERRGVPERVAAWQMQRAEFTQRLTELRLDNGYGSSGLWDKDGKMLGYDLLDLPFPLLKRIAAWQRDFDDTVNPPEEVDKKWQERHFRETIDIASVLQYALGPGVVVKVYGREGWMSVSVLAPE